GNLAKGIQNTDAATATQRIPQQVANEGSDYREGDQGPDIHLARAGKSPGGQQKRHSGNRHAEVFHKNDSEDHNGPVSSEYFHSRVSMFYRGMENLSSGIREGHVQDCTNFAG